MTNDIDNKAICKTCGGTVPNHVPSILDKDGIGNPAHKVIDDIDKTLDEIFSPFSQQSDDKGITLTWSSKDSITEAKAKLKQLILEEADKKIPKYCINCGTRFGSLADLKSQREEREKK